MRIPFAEAIVEPRLLQRRFNELSRPQQVALKALYGVALTDTAADDWGFTERDYWALMHGAGEFDELGYPTRAFPDRAPPPPDHELREGWLIFGRRSGKTDAFASTIVAYEATLGGHESALRPRQVGICFQVAQDLRMARNALHFIRAVLESSPLLEGQIVQITADRIDLKNRFTIACVPATLKSVRGYASPLAVFDEIGVWYQEAESANPDYEIYRAMTPGQIQFPDAKIVGISSPWNKAGLLYQYAEAGTGGWRLPVAALRSQYANAVVLQGGTALMRNPQVTREYLRRERERDELSFARECLAEFQDSISGFLPPTLVELARETGVYERPHSPRFTYHAVMDPAFRRDAFAFAVVHNEAGTIHVDCVRRFVGSSAAPLSPAAVLDQICPLLASYHTTIIYSDQYHLESLTQLFAERGISVIGVTFTAKKKSELYANLQQLFLQRKIKLVDDYETLRELKSLERTVTGGGQVQIAAPPGLHDDMATVVCIGAGQAMYDLREREAEGKDTADLSAHARCMEQVRAKWAAREEAGGAWD